jgi:group I intron endonuclease
MISGIYWIRNVINGKVYIGCAVNIASRLQAHRRGLRMGKHFNRHLQNAWNKYGEGNFSFEEVEKIEDADLIEREAFWIDKFDSTNRAKGYNLCSKGSSRLGVKASLETRQKLSACKIGSKNPMHGKPASGCFTGLKGEKNWNFGRKGKLSPNSKTVLQCDLSGNVIKIWDSQVEICKSEEFAHFGNQLYRISRCLNGRKSEAFGFTWKFESDNIKKET